MSASVLFQPTVMDELLNRLSQLREMSELMPLSRRTHQIQ